MVNNLKLKTSCVLSAVLFLSLPGTGLAEKQPAQEADVKKRLKTLDELKKDGMVTKEEYRTKRKEILNSL